MNSFTCPSCQRMFAAMSTDDDDLDDDFEEDSGVVSCPFCLRSFDPYARADANFNESQTVGLEDLVEFDGGDDDDEDDEAEEDEEDEDLPDDE